MSYNSFIKQAACETPKVVVDPINKEDRIYDMINGHVKDMSMWMPKRKPLKELKKTAEEQPGTHETELRTSTAAKNGYTANEALITLLGGLGGGGLGYLLSRLAGIKNKRKQLIWALLGGGVGALGSHLGMDISDSSGKSMRTRLREAQVDPTALDMAKKLDKADAEAAAKADGFSTVELLNSALGLGRKGRIGSTIGAFGGGIWGLTPWRFDISGQKTTEKLISGGTTASDIQASHPTNLTGVSKWLGGNWRNKNIQELANQLTKGVNAKGKPTAEYTQGMTGRRIGSTLTDFLAHAYIGKVIGGATEYVTRPYARSMGSIVKDLTLGKDQNKNK